MTSKKYEPLIAYTRLQAMILALDSGNALTPSMRVEISDALGCLMMMEFEDELKKKRGRPASRSASIAMIADELLVNHGAKSLKVAIYAVDPTISKSDFDNAAKQYRGMKAKNAFFRLEYPRGTFAEQVARLPKSTKKSGNK